MQTRAFRFDVLHTYSLVDYPLGPGDEATCSYLSCSDHAKDYLIIDDHICKPALQTSNVFKCECFCMYPVRKNSMASTQPTLMIDISHVK